MENQHNQFLSSTECNAMKGFAILCVMMHNFCHFLTGAMRENEFDFSLKNG